MQIYDAHILNFEVGQKIKLKYFGTDPATGRIRLSRRALQIANNVVKDFNKIKS